MAEQRKSSENAYQEQRWQNVLLKAMMMDVSDAIAVTSSDGEIIYWNTAAQTLFGYTANEIEGRSIGILVDTDSFPPIRSVSSGIEDVVCQTKDGNPVTVTVKFGGAAAEENYHWYIFREKGSKSKYEEVLKEKDRAMESFTYSVSHDLRAPLRRIINYAQILQEDHQSGLDQEVARLISRMVKNAEKMGELMDDVLAYSRISHQDMRKSLVNTNNLVDSIIMDLKKHPHNNRISFDVRRLENVFADPALLRLVFENLLDNAVKFSRHSENPEIEIGSEVHRDSVEYYVKDNGAGFDPQYSGKLFTIFQRLHSPTEYEGNGIGLAIVHQIVSRHSGQVTAESTPGKGSIFRFALPKEFA